MSSLRPDAGIRLSIDSRLENVFLVGLAVHAYADYLGFDAQDAGLLELAVIEAVNNAVTHGCAEQPGHRVAVSVTIPPGWTILTVSCAGAHAPGFSWPKMIGDASRERLSESGRGLYIINRVMDHVHFESTGNRQVLTMKKRRPGAPLAPGGPCASSPLG